jgi:transcriptional regulator with XRE-family HTH domain
VSDQNNLQKFSSKKYRDGYLQSRVRGYIAYQVQALREQLGLTQAGFANLTGKQQSTISRLEDTEYGRVSVQTLLDIACAANVALIVKFASYPDFLDQTRSMNPGTLQPDTIQESLRKAKASLREIGGGAAYKHFEENQSGQQHATTSVIANDNMAAYARAATLPMISQPGAA